MQTKKDKNNIIKKISFEDKIKGVSPNIKQILLFLISENVINQNKVRLIGDLENNIKQEIEESIKEKYENLNEKFSELRKSGKDLGVLNFKLVMIPLKIKVFLSTYEKKDIENILRRMQEIEKEINHIKI